MTLMPTLANAAEHYHYTVTGPLKGSFCRYVGFVCSFRNVDAVSFGSDELHHITDKFPNRVGLQI